MKLYHLSKQNHDGEVFVPRVPNSAGEGEDVEYKRICFSSTISGAWRAHPSGGADDKSGCVIYDKFYVHVPAKVPSTKQIKFPDIESVPDIAITDEVWVTRKTRMKCIGIVEIGCNRQDVYVNDYTTRYPIHFKWIKRF